MKTDKNAIQGKKGRFAYFATSAQGRKALIHQLTIVANGSSPAYNAIARRKGYANCGELNLQEFFAIYAPSSDHNDPLNYVKYIALQTGFSALTKVKELLSA